MTLPRALPWLDERRSALLAEIGLTPWWQPRTLLPGLALPAARPPAPTPPAPSPAPAAPALAAPLRASPTPPTSIAPTAPAAATLQTPAWDWPALLQAIEACQRCGLGACRQRAVAGVGDRQPDWLIVGEAPGEEEDRQGEPFVGRAGRLLDRMLAALDLQRGQRVYITNVLKCRPPRNRNPEPDEIARCTPYLRRQIALLRPRIVLALGRFAAQTLLIEGGCLPQEEALRAPLGRLRGRVFTARFDDLQVPVVVSYHPAYLLRNPADKGKAWADLCLAADTWSATVQAGTATP